MFRVLQESDILIFKLLSMLLNKEYDYSFFDLVIMKNIQDL